MIKKEKGEDNSNEKLKWIIHRKWQGTVSDVLSFPVSANI